MGLWNIILLGTLSKILLIVGVVILIVALVMKKKLQ